MDILKLFVWKDVWSDYTQGVAFALAHDVNEARMLVVQAMAKQGHDYPWIASALDDEPEVYEQPYGFGVMGGG